MLRWTGNGVIHFWQGQEVATGQYAANAPRAVFCRQWDWTFGSAQSVNRTFGIFNDTHDPAPITFTRMLLLGGKEVYRKTSEHQVVPGGDRKLDEPITLPSVTSRTEGSLTLALSVAGREVFRDVKDVSVLPPASRTEALAKLTAADLAVCDPSGAVSRFLKNRGIAFTAIPDLKSLPERARLLLVGKDAIPADRSASTSLAAFALEGKRVVVLDQKEPLRYQAVQPAEMEAASNEGYTAFIEDLTHPAVRGLKQKDFFTWNPGEAVYRNAYVKPTRNARSIIQCHEKLANTGLVEIPVGPGLMLLCQLCVGEKLESNAVARQLFLNLLEHAATYKLVNHPTVAVLEGAPQLAAALDRIGLVYERHSDPLSALEAPGAKIAVIAASPANLKVLASHLGPGRCVLQGRRHPATERTDSRRAGGLQHPGRF